MRPLIASTMIVALFAAQSGLLGFCFCDDMSPAANDTGDTSAVAEASEAAHGCCPGHGATETAAASSADSEGEDADTTQLAEISGRCAKGCCDRITAEDVSDRVEAKTDVRAPAKRLNQGQRHIAHRGFSVAVQHRATGLRGPPTLSHQRHRSFLQTWLS